MPGTSRRISGILRAPLARISSLSSTVMLPGTSAGACFRRVALSTVGSSSGSRLSAQRGWAVSPRHRVSSAAAVGEEGVGMAVSGLVTQCWHGNGTNRVFHHRFAIIAYEHILLAVQQTKRNLHKQPKGPRGCPGWRQFWYLPGASVGG